MVGYWSLVLIGQPITYGEYVNERDGQSYLTIQLSNTTWLATNMAFQTPTSENHVVQINDESREKYYYPLEAINQVCPNDFRIPTTQDWENYVELILELKDIPTALIKRFRPNKKGDELVGLMVRESWFKPFDAPNPLNLVGSGHTEAGHWWLLDL